MTPNPAALATYASSSRKVYSESRRPWWVSKNSTSRPVR